MKKSQIKISSPEEFNKHLQHNSPFVWIILFVVIAIMISFFAWAILYKLTVKLTGKADIVSGEVTLHIKDSDLNKLEIGQKVVIKDKEGEIISFNDDQPVVSTFALPDDEYTYTIILRQARPIDFLLGK